MSETPTKLTRRHKLFLASLATVSLSLGAAGVVSAAQSPNHSTPPASAETPGIDCTDGLVAGTTTECDGGPAANALVDAAEGDDGTDKAEKAEKSEASDEADGVNCENGLDPATGAECDGGPAVNSDNDPTEAGSAPETEAASK